MAEILIAGAVTIVSDEDLDYLSQWNWSCSGFGYVYHQTTDRDRVHHNFYMHKLILLRMGYEVGLCDGDHKDRDKLNNQRENLRPATRSQNHMNRAMQRTNTSGYRGVSWDQKRGNWRSYIVYAGRQRHLGNYNEIVQAARAFDRASMSYYGDFALLNGV